MKRVTDGGMSAVEKQRALESDSFMCPQRQRQRVRSLKEADDSPTDCTAD